MKAVQRRLVGVTGSWALLAVLVLSAPALAATPQPASNGLLAGYTLSDPEPEFVADGLPWLKTKDLLWHEQYSNYWNHSLRAGHGGLSLQLARYTKYVYADIDGTLQPGDVSELHHVVKFESRPLAGISIYVMAGITNVNAKRDNVAQGTSFGTGWNWGVGFKVGTPIGERITLLGDVSVFEFRANRASTVVAGSEEIFGRWWRAEFVLNAELIAERGGLALSISAGIGAQTMTGRQPDETGTDPTGDAFRIMGDDSLYAVGYIEAFFVDSLALTLGGRKGFDNMFELDASITFLF